MNYPRTVVLEDVKLKKALQEKEDMILIGREVSEEIEDIENDMAIIDTEIQALEKKVDLSDLEPKAQQLTDEMNILMEKMEAAKKEVWDRIRAQVPKEVTDRYEAKKQQKEALEVQRNKIALKVQKKLDRIIPLGRKVMRPFLENEYEDYDSLRIENGEVVGTIFSHLEDFMKRHKEKAT